jgi:uncharacterized protein
MTDMDDRIFPMDFLRGAAVLAIPLLLAGTIALPASIDRFPGLNGESLAASLAWLARFTLLDGKVLGLFAMLFGASTLLVIDRAEMEGRDGFAAQRLRLLWLLPIGALHYLLLWQGDYLMLLALSGLLVLRFAGRDPLDLIKWALAFFVLRLAIGAGQAALSYWSISSTGYSALLRNALVHDIALYRSSYGTIALARLGDAPAHLATSAMQALPEILTFILLGMAMAMAGFFTGQWSREQYARTVRHAYMVGLPPTLMLGLWGWLSDDPRVAGELVPLISIPFSIPVAIGHAALLILAGTAARPGIILQRVAAVGRTALSNYLLSSVLLTTLAYGYGLGLFARLDRISLLAIGLGLCALMLLWSPHWLRRLGAGPAERLWHALRRTGQSR